MKTETLDRLRSRIVKIEAMPAIPVILRPLLRCLDQPVELVDMDRIVELVSYDKSIAAQCIRMANSALFMRNTPAETVRSAVMSLGMWRVRDLLFSNSLSQVIPANRWVVDPAVFWRHSLGVALVYLGEHYLVDLLAGAALTEAIRVAAPRLGPGARRVAALVDRLEAQAARS